MKWQQQVGYYLGCEFIEQTEETPYTPSGAHQCDEFSIGFVWWQEDEKGMPTDALNVCLEHFLDLYNVDGCWESAGGYLPNKEEK